MSENNQHNQTEGEETVAFTPLTVDSDEITSPHIPVKPQLLLLGLVLLLLFGAGLVPKFFASQTSEQAAQVPSATEILERPDPVQPELYFEDVAIRAQSAFVWDVQRQRVLYEKNPDAQLPLASIAKLMTALVAHELINSKNSVPVSHSALQQNGESGLRRGEIFNLEALSDLTLLSSSNDGAFAMAAAAGALLDEDSPTESFIAAMNIKAKELGLTQTYFRNPTGLDISDTEAGAYGSAREVAFLMEHILKQRPEILEETAKSNTTVSNQSGGQHKALNTNKAVSAIPGIIGSKTGFTNLAGGNLTIAFDAGLNRPIIIAVLDSTVNERFTDVTTLAEKTRAIIK